jgi:hypothetical protein
MSVLLAHLYRAWNVMPVWLVAVACPTPSVSLVPRQIGRDVCMHANLDIEGERNLRICEAHDEESQRIAGSP